MKNKIFASLLTIAVVLSLGACGNPENKNSDASSVKYGVVKTDENIEGYRMKIDTSNVGENNDLTDLMGNFVEIVDGKETAYISINEVGATYVSFKTKAPVPLGVFSSDKGIMIYRATKTAADDYIPYTFDGTYLRYEKDNVEYEWKRIDFFPLEGEYKYNKMDNSGEEIWEFNEDGTGTWTEFVGDDVKSVNFKFKQEREKLFVDYEDGFKNEYSYNYDNITLFLDYDGIVIELVRI